MLDVEDRSCNNDGNHHDQLVANETDSEKELRTPPGNEPSESNINYRHGDGNRREKRASSSDQQ